MDIQCSTPKSRWRDAAAVMDSIQLNANDVFLSEFQSHTTREGKEGDETNRKPQNTSLDMSLVYCRAPTPPTLSNQSIMARASRYHINQVPVVKWTSPKPHFQDIHPPSLCIVAKLRALHSWVKAPRKGHLLYTYIYSKREKSKTKETKNQERKRKKKDDLTQIWHTECYTTTMTSMPSTVCFNLPHTHKYHRACQRLKPRRIGLLADDTNRPCFKGECVCLSKHGGCNKVCRGIPPRPDPTPNLIMYFTSG